MSEPQNGRGALFSRCTSRHLRFGLLSRIAGSDRFGLEPNMAWLSLGYPSLIARSLT